jgi:hypothetical protein
MKKGENQMFQPSKTLTAWSLLMSSGDADSQKAAQIIEQACAHELLHAFLNGEIGPVSLVPSPKVEPKPEFVKPKPVPAPQPPQPEPQQSTPPKRKEKPLFAPEGGGQPVADLGKHNPLPVKYYKSEPVKVNGILIGKLVDKLQPTPTAFLKQCGLKNGKGYLRSVIGNPETFTISGQWLIELFGEQVRA